MKRFMNKILSKVPKKKITCIIVSSYFFFNNSFLILKRLPKPIILNNNNSAQIDCFVVYKFNNIDCFQYSFKILIHLIFVNHKFGFTYVLHIYFLD